jgi:hypothetical protein
MKEKPIIEDVEYKLAMNSFRDVCLPEDYRTLRQRILSILNVMLPSVAKPAGIISVM